MSAANPNADYFFQTSSSIEDSARKSSKAANNLGDPVRLDSKLLAVLPSNHGHEVFVAESAGHLRKVNLNGGRSSSLGAAGAPLTSLARHPTQPGVVYAGCWDKKIYCFGSDAAPLESHTDFVKCMVPTKLGGRPVLISGGADAAIIVWDLERNAVLHKLKGHSKAVLDLAIDPLTQDDDSLIVFSASSDREIRQWSISIDKAGETNEPMRPHETSVNAIRFDSAGDLWTASADKTAKHLVRDRGWEADTILPHSDFVRDVVVMERIGVAVTACRDEGVRVWDLATGDLKATFDGHYEEVCQLAAVDDKRVVSVSIDGTVRTWDVSEKGRADYIAALETKDEPEVKKSMLTAEEEAELAELMSDDDD